jgi:hypothetical protein
VATCENGHEVGEKAVFCGTCGVAIPKVVPDIPIRVVQKRKARNRAVVVGILLIVGLIVVTRHFSGGSSGGLNLQTSTCTNYEQAASAQQIAFVESWDSELVVVGSDGPLQTGLEVMQLHCLPGGNINSSTQPIGQYLFDGAFIG